MAEILREEAMRVSKRNNLDGETYVRYAKIGKLTSIKGLAQWLERCYKEICLKQVIEI